MYSNNPEGRMADFGRTAPIDGPVRLTNLAASADIASQACRPEVAAVQQNKRILIEENPEAGNSSRQWTSTQFDPHADIRNPAGDMLTDRVQAMLPMRTGRGRRESPFYIRQRLRATLANALRCHHHRALPHVSYYRQDRAYAQAPLWLRGGKLAKTTDQLAAVGLLMVSIGQRQTLSTYSATDELIAIAEECNAAASTLRLNVHTNDLVRFYATKVKHWHKGLHSKRERIWPPSSEATLKMSAELQAYNAFLSEQEIALSLTEEELCQWAAGLNEEGEFSGVKFRLPEMLQTDLYRAFNNENETFPTLKHGGRLYGGWWINTPKRLRPRITINGKPTVELDYSGCHINMLYHLRGLQCDGDPYLLPEISAYEVNQGLQTGSFRACIKQYTQALINSPPGGRPSNITLSKDTTLPPDFRPIEIIRMIETRHKPIALDFKSNAGIGLQRIDSDIAMELISLAMAEGYPVLPIHDSFVANESYRERLHHLMKDLYLKRFSFDIDVN